MFYNKKSYDKLNNNRFENLENEEKPQDNEIKLNDHNFFRIKYLGKSNSYVQLIYHIELEQLFALKTFFEDNENLFKREERNYSKIIHPLLPKYYGFSKYNQSNHLLIEYIKGKSLHQIKELKLNKNEKLRIIYEIMKIIEYLHYNKFIYRDLRPNNFIIDNNKDVILIDFDRMLTINDEQCTKKFQSIYIAPEVNQANKYSYEVDIYSLGYIIYFIIMEKKPSKHEYFKYFFGYFEELHEICELCINENKEKRPKINEIIYIFEKCYLRAIPQKVRNINKNIWMESESFSNEIKFLMFSYSICANKNDTEAQYKLGEIYYDGEYVSRDINKAVYYLSLAAN